MIKEQAIDALTLGNVSVTETDYCGGKVAVMASDGIDHWCDLCGKVEYACTHDHQYAYDTDARLYGTDAETGKRRQLTPEEAYWYIYDGQSDRFGNVGENARAPEVRIEGCSPRHPSRKGIGIAEEHEQIRRPHRADLVGRRGRVLGGLQARLVQRSAWHARPRSQSGSVRPHGA